MYAGNFMTANTAQRSFEPCVSVQHSLTGMTMPACEDFSQTFWTKSTLPLDEFPAGIP